MLMSCRKDWHKSLIHPVTQIVIWWASDVKIRRALLRNISDDVKDFVSGESNFFGTTTIPCRCARIYVERMERLFSRAFARRKPQRTAKKFLSREQSPKQHLMKQYEALWTVAALHRNESRQGAELIRQQ